jgi:hypothetical protein
LGRTHAPVAGSIARSKKHSERLTAGVDSTIVIHPCRPQQNHIQTIQEKGRLGWQKAVGYGKRSLVETGMFRYKTLIGPTLRARKLNQTTQLSDSSKFITFDTPGPSMAFQAFPAGPFSANGSRFRG